MSSTFNPHQNSPLTRIIQMDPLSSTSGYTASLWDQFERHVKENAKKREMRGVTEGVHGQRTSNGTVLDIIKSYGPLSSPGTPNSTNIPSPLPRWEFSFQKSSQRKRISEPSPTTIATCKSCKQPIESMPGICEPCIGVIIPSPSFSPVTGETTPPLSPARRNFAVTDLSKLRKLSIPEDDTSNSSPKRRPRRSPTHELADPPIRLSSLRPPPPSSTSEHSTVKPPRSRKPSLTDPNDPPLRVHMSRRPITSPQTCSQPPTPTTPPPTSYSYSSNPCTRRSSLANVTTPPSYARHDSVTPSELSTLFPYRSNATTPPSVGRASNALQTTTSAWDDWDSEGEDESEEGKVGLVGYWRNRKWSRSRGSLGRESFSGTMVRRDGVGETGDGNGNGNGNGKDEGRRKRRGFVRVISCGCDDG